MRSLTLVLVLVTGCATHRAAKTTLGVGAAITAVGLVTGAVCIHFLNQHADAPNDALLYCPLALGVLAAGVGTSLVGGVSLALPEDPPDTGSGSATAAP